MKDKIYSWLEPTTAPIGCKAKYRDTALENVFYTTGNMTDDDYCEVHYHPGGVLRRVVITYRKRDLLTARKSILKYLATEFDDPTAILILEGYRDE